MTTTVVVASREIVDAVYRAAKMAGAPAGMASLLGRSTCFAVGQLDRSLACVTDHLSAAMLPPFGFPHIARAQLGDGQSIPVADCSVGDLAYHGVVASAGGLCIDFELRSGQVLTPAEWMSPDVVEHDVAAASARRAPLERSLFDRISDRHADVLSNGVRVNGNDWRRLTAAAHRYLVPEALIDAVDTPTD